MIKPEEEVVCNSLVLFMVFQQLGSNDALENHDCFGSHLPIILNYLIIRTSLAPKAEVEGVDHSQERFPRF